EVQWLLTLSLSRAICSLVESEGLLSIHPIRSKVFAGIFTILFRHPSSIITHSNLLIGMLRMASVLDGFFSNRATFDLEIVKHSYQCRKYQASPHTPGSGYVLLHHLMGETDGDRGVWSYVEGGMGAVSLAISNVATEAGAHIVIDTEVYLRTLLTVN
ncbi:hypothetical protein GIB67_004849, partial [Kingdonia uniflora]